MEFENVTNLPVVNGFLLRYDNCNSDSINNINNDRSNFDRYDSCETINNGEESTKEHELQGLSVSNDINIFRYKFADDFMSELYKFAKIHQYDVRADYKEAWEKWTEENDDLIKGEVRRLTNLGYDGDCIGKMYKSARYYLRKKSTEKKPAKERREYVASSESIISAMDSHIKEGFTNDKSTFKPSTAFDEFCKNNLDVLKEEINLLCKNGYTDSDEIKNKIKKTYKNRYFLISHK